MTDSKRDIDSFLKHSPFEGAKREFLAGDASFRRYERLQLPSGERFVLMDAPPPMENITAFAAMTSVLRAANLRPPEIYLADIAQGYLVLEDFGDQDFKRYIASHPLEECTLYKAAIDRLVTFQCTPFDPDIVGDFGTHHVAPYSKAFLQKEIALFADWYSAAMTGVFPDRSQLLDCWDEALDFVIEKGGQSVPVLRDYHAENLMWISANAASGESGDNADPVGLLDYQDALIGHPAYDLVSLLQDARRDVPAALEREMIDYYLQARQAKGHSLDREDFLTAYAILGVQRNLKIMGIFTRLCLRDGKDGYLSYLPRLWEMVNRSLNVSPLAPVQQWLGRVVQGVDQQSVPCPSALKSQFPLPEKTMILCAGLGTRMGALSKERPKPLVSVAGKALLDRILDDFWLVGSKSAVINVHHLADQMENHLTARPQGPAIILSDERDALLETGGGVLKALPLLGDMPFFVANADAIWFDDPCQTPLLQQLANQFNPATMDILLIAIPVDRAHGYDGVGDFYMGPDGRVDMRGDRPDAPYMFGGIRIMQPAIFDGETLGAWSMRRLFHKAAKAGRLHATVYTGHWMHVGDPDAVRAAENAFAQLEQGA